MNLLMQLLFSMLITICVDPACTQPIDGASVWVLYNSEQGAVHYELITNEYGIATFNDSPLPSEGVLYLSACTRGYSIPCNSKAVYVEAGQPYAEFTLALGERQDIFLPIVITGK